LTEFQFRADWPLFSLDLNSLGFSILCVLQVKVQAMPHSNLATLCLSIAAEWAWLAAVYIQKNIPLACSAAAKKPPLRKIIFELNRCLVNSPTHISGYFSGLEEA
jgi:hypothetical protein